MRAKAPLTSSEKLALAFEAADGRKAQEIVALDLRELTLVTDFFLICQGTSDVHLRGIAEAVLERFKQAGQQLLGQEGFREARWILLDYGDLVVHIFAEEEREYYQLERLWAEAPRVALAPKR